MIASLKPSLLLRNGARKALSALADQSLVSGTIFATGFLLARAREPHEFGIYVLTFQVLLFFGGLQSALVSQPLVVLGQRSDPEFCPYASSLAAATLLTSTTTAGVIFVASKYSPATIAPMLTMLAMALVFVPGQEFCRQVLFTRHLPGHVLANDIVCCMVRLGVLMWLRSVHMLSAATVLFAVGASAAFGLALGLVQTHRWVRFLRPRTRDLKENWGYGKWVLGTFLAGSLLLFGTTAVVAALAGIAATATLEAHRLVLAPLQVLSTGTLNVLAPELARAYSSGGRAALGRLVRATSGPWTLVFTLYAAVVALAPNYWLALLYPGRYVGTGVVLVLSTLIYAVAGLRILPWAVITAHRRPDLGLWAGLSAGIFSLLMAALLTRTAGLAGAAIARLVGEIILLVAGLNFAWQLMRPAETSNRCDAQMFDLRVH